MSVPPSDLQAHLGYWLRIVSNAVSQRFARKVEAEGVTVAEWVFLRMLYGMEGLSPSLLAERMSMTRGAISKLSDRLVDKGLITRTTSPEGGRGQMLALTPAATALVPRLATLADVNDATFFGALSNEDRRRLDQLLRTIALDRELTRPPTDSRRTTPFLNAQKESAMDAQRIAIAQDSLQAAHDGSLSFPDIVGRLIGAGFEAYLIDYRRQAATYYLPDGDSVTLDMRASQGAVAAAFDQAGIAAQVKWAQANPPDYNYSAFCANVKALGCAGYLVSFLGRRVLYFSRTAETHVEHFPQ